MDRIILENGIITTLDPNFPQVEAIYIENGNIIAVGSQQDILHTYNGANVKRVDCKGAYLYPGFVDSHMHLSLVGQKLQMIDFREVRSKEEMLRLIRERAETLPMDEWIVGQGWQESMLDQLPSLEELDQSSFGRPVLLSRVCFHSYLANGRAAELAGVRPHQEEPEKGAYGRNTDGRWNGRVYEEASLPFHQAQPKPTFEQKKSTIRQAMELASQYGLTAVHTEDLRFIESVSDLIQIHRECCQEGTYLRTHQLIYQPHFDQLEELGLHFQGGDEWFRLGAMKLFADGSLGSWTAWLQEPYTDNPTTNGLAIHTDDQLFRFAEKAAKRGYPIAAHAIGDAAADQVIRTIEQLQRKYGTENPPRHRLIHAQILQPSMVERIKNAKISLDLQPIFVQGDFPWVVERIGEQRLTTSYAWKTLIEAGIPCAGGSDAPIEPLSPLLGMYSAMTRNHHPASHSDYHDSQKITAEQALRLYTLGSAYLAGEEQERGSITPQKHADFTILDRDLLQSTPEQIRDATVLATIVNGKVAYTNSSII
ncbi:putative amidohydrolase YtcJ [Croceifilum oryzae]|uniref:Amidohydrolase YtcJ n=1 Tax=Croceifilum oryzae TaxID=1553429 RepID=A0AAJ1TNE3_9BACL|nr:amidohydrolase [Croceifilum oryzae]MDQ0417661.1 putative amidohydrolase YtcJ [Croceifilum oryzae]